MIRLVRRLVAWTRGVRECVALVREAVRVHRAPTMPRFTTLADRVAWAAEHPGYRTAELDLRAWYARAGAAVDVMDGTDGNTPTR